MSSCTVPEGRLNLSEFHAAASTAPSASAWYADLRLPAGAPCLPAGLFVEFAPLRPCEGCPAAERTAQRFQWLDGHHRERSDAVTHRGLIMLSPQAGCVHIQTGVGLQSMFSGWDSCNELPSACSMVRALTRAPVVRRGLRAPMGGWGPRGRSCGAPTRS